MTFKNWIHNKILKSDEFDTIVTLLAQKPVIRAGGLTGSARALFLSSLFGKVERPLLFVCATEKDAKNVAEDLESFGADRVFYLPSPETTPYHAPVMDEEIRSARLEVLKNIIKSDTCILTLSLDTLLFNITPKEKLLPFITTLNKDMTMDPDEFATKLSQAGYLRVPKVTMCGEFSVRGDIVDVYYSTYKNPVRIDFFDDTVELIKDFDAITQQSNENLDTVIIPPHKEFVYGDEEIKRARRILSELPGGQEEKGELQERIENYVAFDGEQYYLNLFYEKVSLLDYFDNPILILDDYKLIRKREASLLKEFDDNYHSTAFKRKVKVHPENLLFTLNDIYEGVLNSIECNYLEDMKNPNDVTFSYKGIPVYLGNLELFKKDVEKYLADGYKIMLFASTEIQSERLSGIFNQFNPVDDRFEFKKTGFSVVPLQLAQGFMHEAYKLILLNDYEIFGKRKKISRHFYTRRTQVIDSFMDLKPGDYVVHINHGVGLFTGIERVKTQEAEKDYIAILYADKDKIFIPVEQLNFIQKYVSGEFAKPKLDRIGSKGWTKTKERVKKSVQELANELIKIYSARLKQTGFSFLPDTPWQKEFEARFPYEETEDQLITIEEVKRDMESPRPMDRLICGDVGFGKTEIAIRAAFKSVMSGRQVVMLVPTTILAEQHYETFSKRLKDYPINVEMLSRFRSPAEQRRIAKLAAAGDADIMIGTHRLLSKDVSFKNPGLYIVDEEQRFGVKHKEQLKKIRQNIDCLSMSATPIPRTLHMSLSNIRNISVINTPPKNRQTVETYVTEFNEEVFVEGARRELERGGQIFFLYNRVKTIYQMKKFIEQMLPEARVVVGHGQMNPEELEDVIHQFLHYEYDILLATTIIESGIDMPRVNTIFINRADRFGLSQLYQLRGRVGRSDRKAYAYMFYDAGTALTEDAMKRLRVISEYTELGSGFKVAMKDLEIRGAGNLLGPEQSGDILAVGYQLYCKLLAEAIAELAPEESADLKKDTTEVYLELKYSGYIPDSYINDAKQKMEVYKKIAGITHPDEIDYIKSSLVDRFGKIPGEIKSLFYISEIKILCKQLKISDLIEKSDNIEAKFSNMSQIHVEKLMMLIGSSGGKIYLKGVKPNSIFIKINEWDHETLEQKGEYIKMILLKIKEIAM